MVREAHAMSRCQADVARRPQVIRSIRVASAPHGARLGSPGIGPVSLRREREPHSRGRCPILSLNTGWIPWQRQAYPAGGWHVRCRRTPQPEESTPPNRRIAQYGRRATPDPHRMRAVVGQGVDAVPTAFAVTTLKGGLICSTPPAWGLRPDRDIRSYSRAKISRPYWAGTAYILAILLDGTDTSPAGAAATGGRRALSHDFRGRLPGET